MSADLDSTAPATPHWATFFLSTGRCGTQWFADQLARFFGDLAVVAHEPLSADYAPRAHFAAHHRGAKLAPAPALEGHLERIHATLGHSHYIETGWPAYGVLPQLLERFAGRIRVVHLYRHPVRVAASLATHDVYERGAWTEAVALTPTDPGVRQADLAGARWDSMDAIEKCLFWWTEINAHALALRARCAETPWHTLRFEDVFGGRGERELAGLLEFLGLPRRSEFFAAAVERTDRFPGQTEAPLRTSRLRDFPVALELMERFGYAWDEGLDAELAARYRVPWRVRSRRAWKRVAARVRATLPGAGRRRPRESRGCDP